MAFEPDKTNREELARDHVSIPAIMVISAGDSAVKEVSILFLAAPLLLPI